MTNQDIIDFQDMFKRSFGKELTQDEALEKLLSLVGMMRNVWKPMSQQQLDQLQLRRRQTGDLEDN